MTAMRDASARTSTSESTSLTDGAGPEHVGLVFEKYEGLRNDFLVVDERERGPEPTLPLEVRVALCDRHAGVGGDGVLTLLPPRTQRPGTPRAVVRMHVTNADGSVPEMCGNGLRCVSRWLVDHGVVGEGEEHVVDTDAGPLSCRVGDEGVRVEMRGATLDDACEGGPLLEEPLEAAGESFVACAVSVGNPHLVLRAPADVALARRVGPVLEHHPRFPRRTNVELAALRSPREIDLVVWERGAGLTEACGTGATATVAAFVRAGDCPPDEDVLVHLPGGDLLVRVSADLSRIVMTGPARRVFTGRVAARGR